MSDRGDIRLLLVDDDPMVIHWLEMAFRETEFRVVDKVGTAADALDTVRRAPLDLDLLLVDYRLPDRPGTELVHELRALGLTVPAVLMTANAERGFNELAFESGAQGCLLKRPNPAGLLSTLRRTMTGERVVEGRHPRRTPDAPTLSHRERQMLRLVSVGHSNPSIARELQVGTETVKTTLSRAFAKLGAASRANAVDEARRFDLL